MKSILLMVTITGLAASCEEAKKGEPTNLPMITPKVEEATPEGFKTTAKLNLSSGVVSGIKDLLSKPQIDQASGQPCNGLVNCTLTAIDTRMSSINGRSEEFPRKCLKESKIAKEAGFLDKRIELNVNCADSFHRDSGLVFGINDGVYSGGLMLRQKEADVASNGDFMYSYFVNYDQNSEDVHYISALSVTTQDINVPHATTHIELKTNRNSKSFEVYLVGNVEDYGCGTHIISDNSEIFIETRYLTNKQMTASNCAEANVQKYCLDASDLSEKNVSDCKLKEESFTIEAIDPSQVMSSSEQIFEDIKFESVSESVTNFNDEE